MYVLKARERIGWAAALGMFILSSSCFFYILTIIYRFYVCIEGTGKDRVGGDCKNGPKRCQMRCLGSSLSISMFFIYISTKVLYSI